MGPAPSPARWAARSAASSGPRQKARLAALDAEVVALRVTVAQMREAVAAAEATATTMAAELTVTRER